MTGTYTSFVLFLLLGDTGFEVFFYNTQEGDVPLYVGGGMGYSQTVVPVPMQPGNTPFTECPKLICSRLEFLESVFFFNSHKETSIYSFN